MEDVKKMEEIILAQKIFLRKQKSWKDTKKLSENVKHKNWWKIRHKVSEADLWLRRKTQQSWRKDSGNSVQFRRSGVSDSLRPHEWRHARPPCPSPAPGVHSETTKSEKQKQRVRSSEQSLRRGEPSGGPSTPTVGLQGGARGGVRKVTPGFSTEARQARREWVKNLVSRETKRADSTKIKYFVY